MRLLKLSFTLFSLVLVLASCEKENMGNYAPVKKVDKIYFKSGSRSRLYESWYWFGNTPSKIERYDNSGNSVQHITEFTYNAGKITLVKRGSETTEYIYEGEKLVKVNYCRYGDIVEESYDVEYLDKKPSKIFFTIGKGRNMSDAHSLSPLSGICNDPEIEKLVISKCKKNSKGEPNGEIDLKWVDNNIVRLDVKTYTSGGSDKVVTYNYSYDKMKNPFSGFLSLEFENFYDGLSFTGELSSNNVLRKTKTVFNESLNQYVSESWTYDFEYDKKIPVSLVVTHHPQSGMSSVIGTYTFKY